MVIIVDRNLTYKNHKTYNVNFYDDSILTTVTSDPNTVSKWISNVEYIHRRRLRHLIVGLDVECRISFNRNVKNTAATLQLCVGRRCIVYQLIHSPYIPDSLVDFLANSDYTFVGVGIKQDVERLQEDYQFGFDTNIVDLRDLAADEYDMRDLKNAGLKKLASIVLEKEVDKPKKLTLSRWQNLWLTPAQVQYACIDAFVSFEIGRVLNASRLLCTQHPMNIFGIEGSCSFRDEHPETGWI